MKLNRGAYRVRKYIEIKGIAKDDRQNIPTRYFRSRQDYFSEITISYKTSLKTFGVEKYESAQAVKINKKTRFYALKCALLTFCNAFFSKKRRLNG